MSEAHKKNSKPIQTTSSAVEPSPMPERPASSHHKIRIRLFGVGGAGLNAVTHIAREREQQERLLSSLDLVAVNTDVQALDNALASEKVQIGAHITHGLGAGGDPEQGARAAQHDAQLLESLCRDVDVVFLIAGLGGGTGTGAAVVLARLAKQQGALVLAFVTLPFGFEGERRRQQAMTGLEQLKTHADAVICIPNDRLYKVVGDQAGVVEAFEHGHNFMATGVRAVWQLLARKGLINLDFGDLRATLGAKHSDGMLSHGEAAGDDRAREAVKAMLENPLFDGHETLSRSESVLVSILGGPDMSLGDVQKVMEPITRQAPKAHIIMGAAVEDSYTGRLAVTVIAATQTQKRADTSAGASLRHPPKAVAHHGGAGNGQRRHMGVGGDNGVVRPSPSKPVPATASVKAADPSKPKQETLQLETASRGRFDKTEPTLVNGEDLDVPTFIRRGIAIGR